MCEECGYIGDDLSLPPTEEEKQILQSEEYRRCRGLYIIFDVPFRFFLAGYYSYRLHRYEEAIVFYYQAIKDGQFMIYDKFENELFDRVVEIRGPDTPDDLSDLPALFVRESLIEVAKFIDYGLASPLPIFLITADSLRRNEHFDMARRILAKRLEKEEGDIGLLQEELALCQEKDHVKILEIPIESE